MSLEIKESDWKIYRKLHPIVLERFCRSVLSEVEQINGKSGESYHQKYLDIFRLLKKQDKEIALLFDNPRRSAAIEMIVGLKSRNLLTNEEFLQFSEETQERVRRILEIFS